MQPRPAPGSRTLLDAAALGVAAVVALMLGCRADAPTPRLQGIVEMNQRSLAFEVPGRLLGIDVLRGDVLARGASIARLDSTLVELEYQSLVARARATKAELDLLYQGTRSEEIDQARARVRGAEVEVAARRKELERVQALEASRAATMREVDAVRRLYDHALASQDEARSVLAAMRRGPRAPEIQAGEARLQAADASARAARERIARHLLLADGPGEVLDVPVEPGEFVSAGTTVVTLADTEHPYVDVFVPQGELGELTMGMAVRVRSDSLSAPIGGRVEHVARSLEYTPRFLFSPEERPYLVARVRVRLADPSRALHAGVPAFVELETPASGVALPPEPRRREPADAEPRGTGERGEAAAGATPGADAKASATP